MESSAPVPNGEGFSSLRESRLAFIRSRGTSPLQVRLSHQRVPDSRQLNSVRVSMNATQRLPASRLYVHTTSNNDYHRALSHACGSNFR